MKSPVAAKWEPGPTPSRPIRVGLESPTDPEATERPGAPETVCVVRAGSPRS